MSETIAFVGAAGGAGTTRLTFECAKLLAHEGRDTIVLDAAYGTQGLADRISGRIAPDMTQLCLDDEPLESGTIDQTIDGAGRLAVCPAHAPFERLARAKTVEAAERFEQRIEEATRHFEFVLVDTPPIAANQAVAAVHAVQTIAVVCDSTRAEDAVPRTLDRLLDIGVERSSTLVTGTTEHPDADVTIPTFDASEPALDHDAAAHGALLDVIELLTGVSIERHTSDSVLEKLSFG